MGWKTISGLCGKDHRSCGRMDEGWVGKCDRVCVFQIYNGRKWGTEEGRRVSAEQWHGKCRRCIYVCRIERRRGGKTSKGAGGAEGAGCGKRAGNCRLCVSVYRKSVCMGRYEPHKRSGLFRIRTVSICTFWNRTSAYDMGYGECGNGGKLRSGSCGRHYLI